MRSGREGTGFYSIVVSYRFVGRIAVVAVDDRVVARFGRAHFCRSVDGKIRLRRRVVDESFGVRLTPFLIAADEPIARLRDGWAIHAGLGRTRILNRRPEARLSIVDDTHVRAVRSIYEAGDQVAPDARQKGSNCLRELAERNVERLQHRRPRIEVQEVGLRGHRRYGAGAASGGASRQQRDRECYGRGVRALGGKRKSYQDVSLFIKQRCTILKEV